MRAISPGAEAGTLEPAPRAEPYYRPLGDEVRALRGRRRASACRCCSRDRRLRQDALRAPHGVAPRAGPLVTVACHDDLSASDLTGRFLVRGGDTVVAGRSAHRGGARRRDRLPRRGRRGAPGHGRRAAPAGGRPPAAARSSAPASSWRRIRISSSSISYNPGYQSLAKELKPSTRQRFVAIELGLPSPEVEAEIVARRGGRRRGTSPRHWCASPSACARCAIAASPKRRARGCWCTRRAWSPPVSSLAAPARSRSSRRSPTIPSWRTTLAEIARAVLG